MNSKKNFKIFFLFTFLGIFNSLSAQQNFNEYVSVFETSANPWPGFNIFSYGGLQNYSPNHHPIFNMIRANGSHSNPTFVKNGDNIGTLGFTGIDDTKNWVQNARISVYALSDYTNGNYANRMDFLLGGNATCCGETRMSINGVTGNVGIGTITPTEKLEVNGNILLNSFNVGNENGLFFRSGFSSSNKYNMSILAYDHNNSGADPDGLSINAFDGISFATGSNIRNERMRITQTGNVGIGTDNPENSEGWNKVLNVHGNSHSKIITSTQNVITGFWSHDNGFYNSPPGGLLGTYTNHPISFVTNKSTRMIINTAGNVGIGTNEPSGKLDINFNGWGNIPRVVFKSVTDNPGINFYRPTGSGTTAYPWRIEENLGVLEFQTGSHTDIGSESLKTVLSMDQYNVEIGKGNNQDGQRSSLQISSFDAAAKFYGTLHSNWEENQRTFDIYTNDQVSQLKIDASSNPSGKILLLPGSNANVGIGTLNPTEKLQIGNAFTFHSGGHDIIGFGFTPSNSTDLNTNAHSAEIRFKKTEGTLALGVSQDNASNPTPALEIWKNNNVTLSYYDWGKVGIGTNNPDAKLTVNGDIHAKEVRVDLNIAPDYVFEKYYDGYSTLKSDYKMPTLQEVEAYTKENKHLPEVPSAQEIKENGLKLGEMNAILLQKVEELTLYLIEQNKEIEKLKTKVDELSKK